MILTKRSLFVVSVLAVIVPAACSSNTEAKARPVGALPVAVTTNAAARSFQGTYVQPPVTITGAHLTGSATTPFHATGGTTWHGDLEGTTAFVMQGVASLKTGASHGTSDETFTGSVAGIGTGHLHFRETFKVSADAVLSLDATIVSGDGDLALLRGRMHFAGPSDLRTGAGSGTYTAQFTTTG